MMNEAFRKLATVVSKATSSVWAFFLALSAILFWVITGPIFNYSDTWQLFINTSTTIVTFLMVFIIQNTQNRDTRAMHLKLDELIKALKGASLKMVDVENLPDVEIEKLLEDFKHKSNRYTDELERRRLRGGHR